MPHPTWIEAVTAVVVPKDHSGLTAAAVHEHTRAVLAGFERPRYVVLATDLPCNPSGKILQRELRLAHVDLATQPPPQQGVMPDVERR